MIEQKSGIAGIMTPYPTATENEIAVKTATSLGNPPKIRERKS